jgi:hypothetical protein
MPHNNSYTAIQYAFSASGNPALLEKTNVEYVAGTSFELDIARS